VFGLGQKAVCKVTNNLQKTPNPSALMAAVLVEGRAGVNVTFPALRTPRGRLMKSLLVE